MVREVTKVARLAIRNGPLLAAVLVSLAIFGAGVAVGSLSISPDWAAQSLQSADETADVTVHHGFWAIVSQNLGAALLLYTGVLTLGVTSVLGLAMVSSFVGATVSVSVNNAGLLQTLGETGMYAPVEFAGVTVAAVAGLYPGFAVLGRMLADRPAKSYVATYIAALITSLKLLACAALLIVAAAVVEAVVISVR